MSPPHSWQAAAALAATAHAGQLRNDDRTPYASHPTRVALTVATVFGVTDETVLTAALLHDVIEDTTIDYDDLLEQFGKPVADIVAALSKDKRLIEEEREKRYDEELGKAGWQAKLIKLADVYDNFHDQQGAAGRKDFIEKVERAVKIAEDTPECAEAIRIVKQSVGL